MNTGIKLVVFDFDGVITSGQIQFDSMGNVIKSYNSKDGMGIKLLQSKGYEIGVISGWKENASQISILKHLNIHRFKLNCKNKIEVLLEWCKNLSIKLQNVAYMGDDVNDIDVLSKVKYSGCPNDALQEVKDISAFKSKFNGGKGAVREFCDLILYGKNQNNVNMMRRDLNIAINSFNLSNVDKLCEIIKNCSGNVYFMGVGKSGNMSKHLCDLLKSISIRAFYISTLDLLHGDIGVFNKDDIVIMFSKSGNTAELIDKISFIKKHNTMVIGICNSKESLFHNFCNVTLLLPHINEIGGNIRNIPTNSCVIQLLFCNMVVSNLKGHIDLDKYSLNHPNGTIGKNCLKIKDRIEHKINKLQVKDGESSLDIINILVMMTNNNVGYCIVTDTNDKMIGIITDGDLRRYRIQNPDSNKMDITKINRDYYYETDINMFLNNLKKYAYIPILNSTHNVIGIINQ